MKRKKYIFFFEKMDLKELSEFYDESTMDFDEFINMHAPKQTTRDTVKQEQDLEYLKSEQYDREKKSKPQEPNPKQEPQQTDDPKPTLKELRALRVKHLEK
jgi:hypothetical protein